MFGSHTGLWRVKENDTKTLQELSNVEQIQKNDKANDTNDEDEDGDDDDDNCALHMKLLEF